MGGHSEWRFLAAAGLVIALLGALTQGLDGSLVKLGAVLLVGSVAWRLLQTRRSDD